LLSCLVAFLCSAPGGAILLSRPARRCRRRSGGQGRPTWGPPGGLVLVWAFGVKPRPTRVEAGAHRGCQGRPCSAWAAHSVVGLAAPCRTRARWHAGCGQDDKSEGSSLLAWNSRRNLVYPGPSDPNHGARMRIGRNSKAVDPLLTAALKPGTSAERRHLKPSSPIITPDRKAGKPSVCLLQMVV
jgi:hypothetical protein